MLCYVTLTGEASLRKNAMTDQRELSALRSDLLFIRWEARAAIMIVW